jgi:hypothetical protein
MDRLVHWRVPPATMCAPAVVLNLIPSGNVSTHIRWLCAFDIAAQPRVSEDILTLEFWVRVPMVIVALAAGSWFKPTPGKPLWSL